MYMMYRLVMCTCEEPSELIALYKCALQGAQFGVACH
jgi:hypothetical protein